MLKWWQGQWHFPWDVSVAKETAQTTQTMHLTTKTFGISKSLLFSYNRFLLSECHANAIGLPSTCLLMSLADAFHIGPGFMGVQDIN